MDVETFLPGLHVVGVTGGVGAGKSTVAKALADALPGTLLDADALVSDLYKVSQVLTDIEVKLGSSIRTESGTLDRTALSQLIFADPQARDAVESVLHPLVRKKIWESLDSLEKSGGCAWAVLDVPLLREGGLHFLCDSVVHVALPAAERCARACARHGWDSKVWKAREQAQIPEAEKAELADAIVDNRADRDSLQAQIRNLVLDLHCLPPRPLRERWPTWDQNPLAKQ
ncbi:MAG: dephospho-CoA kinase [Planctomycetota bacterium]|nr:MAG: dephospho-CoA kinase [Planctomycetota bacterium]